MSTVLLSHPDCLKHDTSPGYPERSDRLRAISRALQDEAFDGLERVEAPKASLGTIGLVHPPAFIEEVRKAIPLEGYSHLDPDTVVSPGSWDAALRAAGAGIEAVDRVMTGKADNAFCAIRPPGHHAEPDRAMGFCLFSNIAIAAFHARAAHGADRVAVVDFDVHHGNGTQKAFWSEKDLFYGSSHQMPLFPGTGAVDETGVGNICNAPLRPGDGSVEFKAAWDDRIIPALEAFSPDLLLISAGFDAHRSDPLAQIELNDEDFGWITERLMEVADTHCDGRVVSMLEGGYALEALARSTDLHVKALMAAAD
ncbi:Histone deacetylase-like amidohydrolase [Methyloligella halotolerans]|uniref:Histone deacetylase-like amidohydrolase n=1 Tax=Methyloligella halotolerans TaxID=1177755 RepID=A0A1E2RYS6_9HYPH|nr:histone deacetylase family protein [Methyloligella halotolerans]ODA67310.1 Histone deacetylase-like amidohydrolase [Methyloligella halotolerans]